MALFTTVREKFSGGRFGDVHATVNPEVVIKVHSREQELEEIEQEHIITRMAADLGVGAPLLESGITYKPVGGYLAMTRLYEFDEDDETDYAKQLIDKIKLLHDDGIVHRDIRADNILFLKGEVFIIDYGNADLPSDPEEIDYWQLYDYASAIRVCHKFEWESYQKAVKMVRKLGPKIKSEKYREGDAYEWYQDILQYEK